MAAWCTQFLGELKVESEAVLWRQLRERPLLAVVRDRLAAMDEITLLELLEAQPVPDLTGLADGGVPARASAPMTPVRK